MSTNNTDRIRRALEKTVPSAEFSADHFSRELSDTAGDTPPHDAQKYLLKTESDPTDTPGPDDSSPVVGFSTTSLVPPELLEESDEAGPRFDIVGEAGRGGTAHVYAVVDRSLGRTIALKLLRGKVQKRKGVRQRFVHEARVTAMLEHPNIVPVYDIGVTDDNRVYFLMKNVTGVSVGDAIRAARGGSTVPEAFRTIDGRLRVLLKVCDAMAFAHSRGFVHQDLKPDNLMLGEYGEVLVLDWGCALGEKERESGKGASYGTPAYMSPEQARQEGADERSDVYCLGATLYHMLTLHHPTWSEDPTEFWELKRAGVISPLPSDSRQDLPESLLDVALKAMAPMADERYQSVVDLQHAIQGYQAHAESIGMTQRCMQEFRAAGSHAEYAEYIRLTAQLEQALSMWEGNLDARDGLHDVRRGHAESALRRGDLELAASIAGADGSLGDILQKVERARADRNRAQARSRTMRLALGALGLALIAALGYYTFDYLRHFGSWTQLFHLEFTPGADLSPIIYSGYGVIDEEPAPDVIADGLPMGSTKMFWLRDVRERGNVRVEVLVQWPVAPDGLEIMLNTRRERGEAFSMCPTGYACQFAGWHGVQNIVSRNTRPGWPDQGNAVGAEFEPGRTYRLWFQRVGEELSLYVDRKRVFTATEPLPLPGEDLVWVGVRSWATVIIQSVTVWRMGAPEKTSPLIAGDLLVERGQLDNAAALYLRVAQDHAGRALEEQAMARAYLAASQVPGSDSLRATIREDLLRVHPGSSYLPLMLQADCLAEWAAGEYDSALALACRTLELDPDSRVALRMVASRPPRLPGHVLTRLLENVGRSTRVFGLSLNGAGLTSIAPLRGLNLRSLDLRDNDIADLSALEGMPLRVLLVAQNPLQDLSPLRGASLVSLDADDCSIRDLGPLRGMPIQTLYLDENSIEDLSPLAGMPLTHLDIYSNQVASIEPLAECRNLRSLKITMNPITDLSPLAGLPLRDLDISSVPASDVGSLSGMPLQILNMRRTNVVDLSPLAGLPLELLNIGYTPVTSLAPLKDMPLTGFTADGAAVIDLSPLRGLQLTALNIHRTDVCDLEPVRGMPLEEVNLSHTLVTDLRPLNGAPLVSLAASGTPLAQLGDVAHTPPAKISLDTLLPAAGSIDDLLDQWDRQANTAAARRSRAALAFRRSDEDAMRELATGYDGHHYLYIPTAVTFDTARARAAGQGCHLVSITSEDELRFVHTLIPRASGIWIGIDPNAMPRRWTSGEDLSFEAFTVRREAESGRPVYMLSGYGVGRCWSPVDDPMQESAVVLEWDD